jgi:hypothetical protein
VSNRLEFVIEAVRHALNNIAAAPEWLAARAIPGWADRYSRRPITLRLQGSQQGRRELTGADGLALLNASGEAAPRDRWPRHRPWRP